MSLALLCMWLSHTKIRWGSQPDGVCLVVGSLGSGFIQNSTADVILTNTPLQPQDAKFNL